MKLWQSGCISMFNGLLQHHVYTYSLKMSFWIPSSLVNTEVASEDSGLPPRHALENRFCSSYHGETCMSKQQLVIPVNRGRALPAPDAMKSKQGNQWNDQMMDSLISWFIEKSQRFSSASNFLLQSYSLVPFVYFIPFTFSNICIILSTLKWKTR